MSAVSPVPEPEAAAAESPRRRVRLSSAVGFGIIHLAALVGVWRLGFSWSGVALCVGSYYLRMVLSMPSLRESRLSLESASRYFFSVSGPFACAFSKISCAK